MKYRAIRNLDKKAAQLFMGTSWFVPPHEEAVFGMLDDYFALGGNAIDTGRFYGGGLTEGIILYWLESRKMAARRDEYIIVNKACHHYVDRNNVHYPEKSRVGAEFITEDLEYSLDNMKQKYFDIYLLHRDNTSVPVEELVDRLELHRREGKIKIYGVSNWSIPRIESAQAYAKKAGYPGISMSSPSYSLATVKTPRWAGCLYADDDYVKWHGDAGIDLLAWAPQASGFFAEIFGDNPPDDVRAAYFTDENFEKLKRAKALAEKRGVSATTVALAYIFHQPANVMASIGVRSRQELDEANASLGVALEPREVEWLSLRQGALS